MNASKTLSEELRQTILLDLENAMEGEKKYLDCGLTMHQLAKEIKTNTSYLSRTIQEIYHTNFASYLNTLRINDAKALIRDHKNNELTLDKIAKASGYKNRSTFHKAFKKMTGLTPDQYRQLLKKQLSE